MEKELLLPPPSPASKAQQRKTRRSVVLSCSALAVALYLVHSFVPVWRTHKTVATPPSTAGIFWSPCPDSLETYCSFLRVPLDYTNPKQNETVSLALRMLPATAPPAEQLGYLFTNPGGPGGSGTASVVLFGTELQTIVDGRYHIISWDPRGVNLTSPDLGCFTSEGEANRFERDILSIGLPYDARGSPELGYSPKASNAAELSWTTKFDAYSQALQQACDANANKGILRGSSTAFTARDMASIADNLGLDKVNYWGFSYGTILGATFAAMFPDKVNRFILDGVSDSLSYTRDFWQWGVDGMTDTHKTIDGFFSACAESGPKGCALARHNSTASELKARLAAIYETLRRRPLAVGQSEWGPGIVTASDVQYTVFHSLYAPKTWPDLASLLAEVERGDGHRMFETANKWNRQLCRKPPADNTFHTPMIGSMASAVVVMCGDTDPNVIRNDTSVEGLRDYMQMLRDSTESPTADEWSIWISQCRRWNVEPFEVYRGPWTVKEGLNKTAFPILFLSMTADPVTPLSAARRMTDNFGPESATLLIQNGFGHCSLAHPSLCTAKKARAYLVDGIVPKINTTCDSDPGFLFPHESNSTTPIMVTAGSDDYELKQALHRIATKFTDETGSRRYGPLR
ncbi:uncharacterized protein JCM15063_001107 [Sporobolomyces koalae]|uniref:uncharacterized protein n=1 Tax=Sporobolomyces koalae TaxID=500713 RepID=UPI0031813B12